MPENLLETSTKMDQEKILPLGSSIRLNEIQTYFFLFLPGKGGYSFQDPGGAKPFIYCFSNHIAFQSCYLAWVGQLQFGLFLSFFLFFK